MGAPVGFTVYAVTCVATGQRYVGQTSKPLGARWALHVATAMHNRRGCRLLNDVIREHGEDVFVVEVLEEVMGKPAANDAERRWIAQLDCRAPNGLNLTRGGGGSRVGLPCLTCAVCGESATRASSNSARSFVARGIPRRAYCGLHDRKDLLPPTPCGVCGEPAERKSAENARYRAGGLAYCEAHRGGSPEDVRRRQSLAMSAAQKRAHERRREAAGAAQVGL